MVHCRDPQNTSSGATPEMYEFILKNLSIWFNLFSWANISSTYNEKYCCKCFQWVLLQNIFQVTENMFWDGSSHASANEGGAKAVKL